VSEFENQSDQETQEFVMLNREDIEGAMARSWHYRALWIIAALSFLLNVLLIFGLFSIRANARQQVTEAADSLAAVQFEPFELPIEVDESLPISMTVPFSDTFMVPISQTVPVSLSVLFEDVIEVPIQEVININTIVFVPVTIPGIGQTVNLEIPIVTDIPIDLFVEVPVSKTIPISTSIPVVFDVDVPVQSDVPIQSEVPVELAFPVNIPLDEMGLDGLIGQIEQALRDLAESLGG
jgi:hypothetical protein